MRDQSKSVFIDGIRVNRHASVVAYHSVEWADEDSPVRLTVRGDDVYVTIEELDASYAHHQKMYTFKRAECGEYAYRALLGFIMKENIFHPSEYYANLMEVLPLCSTKKEMKNK